MHINGMKIKVEVSPPESNETCWRPVNLAMKRATDELKVLSSSFFTTSTAPSPTSSSSSSFTSSEPMMTSSSIIIQPIVPSNSTNHENKCDEVYTSMNNQQHQHLQLTEQINTLQHIIQSQEFEQFNLQRKHATQCEVLANEIALLKEQTNQLMSEKFQQTTAYNELNNQYNSLQNERDNTFGQIERLQQQFNQQQEENRQLVLKQQQLLLQEQKKEDQRRQLERKRQLSKIVSPTDYDSSHISSSSSSSSSLLPSGPKQTDTLKSAKSSSFKSNIAGCLIDISTLRAALCCSICSSTLVDAVVLLSCSHGFCRTCIESEWHRHGNSDKNSASTNNTAAVNGVSCRGACVVCHDMNEYKRTKTALLLLEQQEAVKQGKLT